MSDTSASHGSRDERLVFEIGAPGLRVDVFAPLDVPAVDPAAAFGSAARSSAPALPHATEGELVRHYARLASRNFGVDTGFYPLGSCTMKHNPRISEDAARLAGFAGVHPYQPRSTVQGALHLMHAMQEILAEVSGLPGVTLQPAAGAHGELTALLVFRAYHASRGDTARATVLVPDTAHGTNPASVAAAGFGARQVPSDERGNIDLDALRAALGDDIAAVMLTNPNTLGLFEEHVMEVTAAAHEAGALVYCDGANLNAVLGKARPGDMGFDALHVNLHKTFATPHGGGGPGAGPVCVGAPLAEFLPGPVAVASDGDGEYDLVTPARSIGRVRAFPGNFGVIVKAYAYACAVGGDGLEEVAEQAVLSANYLKERLRDAYDLPYDRSCMHEFVLSAKRQRRTGVRALDIAKRLLDFGFHPPTIYFPLIVEEAMMIEPTETEDIQTLDAFADAMLAIAEEASADPQGLHDAPLTTPVRRLDEARAVKQPDLRWQPPSADGD